MAGEARLAVSLGLATSHIPWRGEARCASPLHGIIRFSVVVFLVSFDLAQN